MHSYLNRSTTHLVLVLAPQGVAPAAQMLAPARQGQGQRPRGTQVVCLALFSVLEHLPAGAEGPAMSAPLLILVSSPDGSMRLVTLTPCSHRFSDIRARTDMVIVAPRDLTAPGILGGLTTPDTPIFLAVGRSNSIE